LKQKAGGGLATNETRDFEKTPEGSARTGQAAEKYFVTRMPGPHHNTVEVFTFPLRWVRRPAHRYDDGRGAL
tara:strand:+ start:6174 stop:6389 length:216 start_codon:yes stop_codon:yes gene_type:complete